LVFPLFLQPAILYDFQHSLSQTNVSWLASKVLKNVW
jgi:hypothetical protein